MQRIFWVSSFAVVFLFIPSLLIKIWEFFIYAPWQSKSWLVYMVFAFVLLSFIRWRWRKRTKNNRPEKVSLLFIAKERLVTGEIGIDEFREIKRELE